MKRRFVLRMFVTIILTAVLLVSCAPKEATSPPATVPATAPTTAPPAEAPKAKGNWWDYHGEPQYGGTLNWRVSRDVINWDPWFAADPVGFRHLYRDCGTMNGWLPDRKVAPYDGGFTPFDAREYQLIESWEVPDNYMTFIIRIKKGIKWQNKPPLNGREFTAHDVVYGWHRMAGLGSGFTTPSPHTYWKGWADFESIKALDKYTIEFKLKFSVPGLMMLSTLAYWQYPKEVQEMYGSLSDWRHQVGTGPFILKDYVAGSSATYVRNPDYWANDERHPKNRLPYLDVVKLLIIPDASTAEAAMRAGKVAVMPGIAWETADAFKKSNPEILHARQHLTGWTVQMRLDREPLSDVRVRKALNMAVDRKKIAETYYGGRVEGKPYSNYGPATGPYYTPFEQWPKDLQEGHTYNPAGARKLLAEAGYPNGFKTSIMVSSADSLDLPLVVKSYFADIGVDMEVKVIEAAVFSSFINVSKRHEAMVWGRVAPQASPGYLPRFSSKEPVANIAMIKDPVLDEIIDREALYPFDSKEKIFYNKQADMYDMERYFEVKLLPENAWTLYQPWLKGYSGEVVTSITTAVAPYFARWWLDHDLMKKMGHR